MRHVLTTVRCDLMLCIVSFHCLVPTTVSTSVNSNVTLPCYARTEKQITDDTVNILWKKDDRTVLQVQKGITTYGSGFTGRVLVSLTGLSWCCYSQCYRLLNITFFTLSFFSCNRTKKFYAKKFGGNLTLDLFGSDHVRVTFTGHDADETPVCSVTGNKPTCSSEYTHRISVINDFLVLRELTSTDTGTFTVKNEMDEVIGVNTVTVEGKDLKSLGLGCTTIILVIMMMSDVATLETHLLDCAYS
uniref:Uncharacterized protein n=1 Tax=Cyprinus carpio TaxID=7962 RepID=A0A8C1WWG1_CYPCA